MKKGLLYVGIYAGIAAAIVLLAKLIFRDNQPPFPGPDQFYQFVY